MDTPGVANATLDNCGVTVNLSPSVPVVGQSLSAALEGPGEGVTGMPWWRWQWRTSAEQVAWSEPCTHVSNAIQLPAGDHRF